MWILLQTFHMKNGEEQSSESSKRLCQPDILPLQEVLVRNKLGGLIFYLKENWHPFS